MDIKLAYVTVGSREEAERIAEAVVTEKLAACANILSGVRSVFEWQGSICREDETLLLLKTVAEQSEKLVVRIKEMHSYECPCIVFLSLEGGNPDFLDWIRNSL
ncbi:divalent-cation tolerance protein CutA [Tichowtungia aerotolerans]|uniref:Divalent cation tolerance protein CutA n=1 Tax=Tichowtungia aerotolerans TaxID=2697043 RepID=A0A6P1M7N9_9BACT|nr:divalent-cation tolerance protein CutA [Tichowtungia aerotolerans]QHI69073.1 divalent cation tolerance protein CutA [Tichowtungia aerotolerans]